MKNWLRIGVALGLMMNVGQTSTEGLETMSSSSTQRMYELIDLERQQQRAAYNQKDCKEESRIEFNFNFLFFAGKGIIAREDIKPILLIGTVCFVSGFSILYYLRAV